MASRGGDYGMDIALTRKLNSKYDPESEKEAIGWVSQVTGNQIPLGRENVHKFLKNGQILVKLIDTIYERTPTLPPGALRIKRPIKATVATFPFKQMENIQIFVDAAQAYGVPKESLFQTVDLYEARNLSQVISTLLQLGTECQRNGFSGQSCGPRPTQSNRREWTETQLRASDGHVSLQAGTNKLASQKGMTMGSQRHVADIRCDNMCPESQGILSLQMGTNKFASQKGMSFGNQRHISDIKCEEMCREGQSIINLQMGTNQCASQKGMRMGASRHIADINCGEASREGQAIIGLQYGTNKCASQKGMSFGNQRHITDIKCEPITAVGSAIIGLQMGLGKDQCATQAGMSFGAQRHINDNH